MHPASSTDRLGRGLLCLLLSTGLCGCAKKVQDPQRLGEWIMKISEAAGLSDPSAEKPYFINVSKDSRYYDAVQACVDWDVLRTDQAFDPEAPLDRAWTAATLVRLGGLEAENTDPSIKDIRDSVFAHEISAAVDRGLMHTDERHLFHPEEIISEADADGLLSSMIAYMDDPKIEETETQITWKEGMQETDARPLSIDPSAGTASFRSSDTVHTGDLFLYEEAGLPKAGRIEEVSEDGTNVRFTETDLLEDSDSMVMQGSADLSFDEAEVISGEGEILMQNASGKDDAQSYLMPAGMHAKEKSFSVAGFDVKLTTGNGRITAEAVKHMPHGTEIYAGIRVNGFHVDYKWKSKASDVSNAFLKLKFDSEEDAGIRNGMTRELYADLSKVDADHFLSSVVDAFKQRSDETEVLIPLAKIRVPIPGAPVLNVGLSLELHLHATGKAEISLRQENVMGCEVRDGAMRMIRDHQNDAKAEIGASTGLTAGIRAALDLVSASLMDVSLEAGAKADVTTTAHLYDSKGHQRAAVVDAAADAVEAAADGNGDVLICTDIDAHWAAGLKVNSGSTLLGKMGMDASIDLLDRDNAPLLPGLDSHYENGHSVDHCTRKDRPVLADASGIRVSEKIRVRSYSLVVHPGASRSVKITALPEGYGPEDLVFDSEAPSIASVSQSGSVTGVHSGSAKIRIRTKDGKHQISIHVLVPER